MDVSPATSKKRVILYMGRYTYDVHENCPIFKTPHPPCPPTSENLPPPPWPWTSNFKHPPPPPSPNNNESIKIEHDSRMTIFNIYMYIICYKENNKVNELVIIFKDYWYFLEWGIGQYIFDCYNWHHIVIVFTLRIFNFVTKRGPCDRN